MMHLRKKVADGKRSEPNAGVDHRRPPLSQPPCQRRYYGGVDHLHFFVGCPRQRGRAEDVTGGQWCACEAPWLRVALQIHCLGYSFIRRLVLPNGSGNLLCPFAPAFLLHSVVLASKHFFPVTAAPLLSDHTLRSGARHGRQARVEAANTPAAGRPFYWRRGRAGSSRQLCSAFVRLVAFC